MTFIEELQQNHEKSINAIKLMTDTESDTAKEYPEYKEAAELCKFIMEYENKYELLVRPEKFNNFYSSASDFEMLCNNIYHSITDDGEISYIQLTDSCPAIVFESAWDLSVDNVMSLSQKRILEQVNVFRSKYKLPLIEYKLTFFTNAYQYIEAVKNYNRYVVPERNKKVDDTLKRMRAVPV
jgi:hypothetical protein